MGTNLWPARSCDYGVLSLPGSGQLCDSMPLFVIFLIVVTQHLTKATLRKEGCVEGAVHRGGEGMVAGV